jgi:large subunit ribosomal protein L13
MGGGSGRTAWLRHRIPQDRVARLADARGQVLGRLASQIATVLMGKHKPTYLNNIFTGDPVVVINAAHFTLTGRKMDTKVIISHTGTPGGLKRKPVRAVLARRPTHPLYLAVKRMLPPNKLRSVRLNNLHLYPGEKHEQHALKPVPLPLAHVEAEVGKGGPPSQASFETWWLDEVCDAPDRVLGPIVADVRAEFSAKRSRGLAELLDLAEGAEGADGGGVGLPGDGGRRLAALRRYAAVAMKERAQGSTFPVVMPSWGRVVHCWVAAKSDLERGYACFWWRGGGGRGSAFVAVAAFVLCWNAPVDERGPCFVCQS